MILSLALGASALDIASDKDFPAFKDFIAKHRGGVGYTSEIETIGRFETFKMNLRLAEERSLAGQINAKPGQKPETHGVTQFMDLTADEFAKFKGFRPSAAKLKAPRKLH